MKNRTQTTRRAVGALVITQVVREEYAIESSSDGVSIGQHIDEYLKHSADEGKMVQTVTVTLDPQMWAEIAGTIYGGYVEEEF